MPEASEPLDLRGEEQPVPLPGPVQRTDPKPVAPEHQFPPALVPQRDGKLPAQLFEHRRLMLLPEVRDDLGIAMFDQPVAARLQLRPFFEVIEKLAVEDHRDASVLVRHRLLAIGEAHDAQPPGAERHAGPVEKTLFIRAAMQQRVGHFLHRAFGDGAAAGEIDDACNAAHI